MTEPTTPKPDEPSADETFTWTSEAPPPNAAKGGSGSTAANILDTVRDVVDDLAERAAPAVRELSARAAELTAIAADKAAPLAKRAGEVTADASGKLASKSREWASDLRATIATAERDGANAPVTPADEPGDRGATEAGTSDRPGSN